MVEIIELAPVCPWCENFRYKEESEKKFRCKMNCICSNDIFELFEDCPRLDYKYGVIE